MKKNLKRFKNKGFTLSEFLLTIMVAFIAYAFSLDRLANYNQEITIGEESERLDTYKNNLYIFFDETPESDVKNAIISSSTGQSDGLGLKGIVGEQIISKYKGKQKTDWGSNISFGVDGDDVVISYDRFLSGKPCFGLIRKQRNSGNNSWSSISSLGTTKKDFFIINEEDISDICINRDNNYVEDLSFYININEF